MITSGQDPCRECGFTFDGAAVRTRGAAVTIAARAFIDVMSDVPPTELRLRPALNVWSSLEYACHVRDVLYVQRERIIRGLWDDEPTLELMGRDERVELAGYATEDLDAVLRQLSDGASLIERVLARVVVPQWERPVIYPWPTPTRRSVRWLADQTVHELEHHRADVAHAAG